MDKTAKDREKGRWSWLPAQMPGVVALMADKKRELGPDWVNECWRRGVVNREPDWFFAAEGALMVGTLGDDAAVLDLVRMGQSLGRPVIVLRNKGAGDGAN